MDQTFEQIVESYYEPLYRFAYSLSQREAEAADLTQQTFYRWATKGHQLLDRSKVKTWLFTTLHREFLGTRRRIVKFPQVEVSEVEHELPTVSSEIVNQMDAATVMQCLQEVDDLYRAPLTLFYLQQHSYQEIAQILDIPIGTVMSRLSRGKQELKKQVMSGSRRQSGKVVPMRGDEAVMNEKSSQRGAPHG
ncbi:MAG: RNA polymerase sigma factor [Blastochloris sp.]|nr:RNA polymerase sigma factor [Blastochloris sp.]